MTKTKKKKERDHNLAKMGTLLNLLAKKVMEFELPYNISIDTILLINDERPRIMRGNM